MLEEKCAVRIALAIEKLGYLILISSILISIGIADGKKAFLMVFIGFVILVFASKADKSNEEKMKYQLFVDQDSEAASPPFEKSKDQP